MNIFISIVKMSCSFKQCKVVDPKELHVRCWICHDEYHAQCAALNARVVALQDRKGIRWSSRKCSAVEIDFASLFKHFSSLVKIFKAFILNWLSMMNHLICCFYQMRLRNAKNPS